MKLFRTNCKHRSFNIKCYPEIGERVPILGCYSEASMHLGVADKPIEIELVYSRTLNGKPTSYVMAQIWKDGREWSFPVTTGEAGFYDARYPQDLYYTYVDESRLTWSQLSSITPIEDEDKWLESKSGTTSLGCLPHSTQTVAAVETESPTESERQKKSIDWFQMRGTDLRMV